MAETSKDWENISTFYQTYMRIEKHLYANTVESYMRDLDIFKHYILRQYDVRPKEVCREMIEHFITWLYENQKYEKSSQARILSGVKSFFNYLLLEEKIDSSPAEFITPPKIDRTLPDTLHRGDKPPYRLDRQLHNKGSARPSDIGSSLLVRAARIGAVRHKNRRFILRRGLHQSNR